MPLKEANHSKLEILSFQGALGCLGLIDRWVVFGWFLLTREDDGSVKVTSSCDGKMKLVDRFTSIEEARSQVASWLAEKAEKQCEYTNSREYSRSFMGPYKLVMMHPTNVSHWSDLINEHGELEELPFRWLESYIKWDSALKEGFVNTFPRMERMLNRTDGTGFSGETTVLQRYLYEASANDQEEEDLKAEQRVWWSAICRTVNKRC